MDPMTALLPMAFALSILAVCLPLVAFSGQQMLRGERRRAKQQAAVDRELIDALENKSAAMENKATAFERLTVAQAERIRALEEFVRQNFKATA